MAVAVIVGHDEVLKLGGGLERERSGQLKTLLRSRINRVWCQIEGAGKRGGGGSSVWVVGGQGAGINPSCNTGRRTALWEGSTEFRFESEERATVSTLGERSGQEVEIDGDAFDCGCPGRVEGVRREEGLSWNPGKHPHLLRSNGRVMKNEPGDNSQSRRKTRVLAAKAIEFQGV